MIRMHGNWFECYRSNWWITQEQQTTNYYMMLLVLKSETNGMGTWTWSDVEIGSYRSCFSQITLNPVEKYSSGREQTAGKGVYLNKAQVNWVSKRWLLFILYGGSRCSSVEDLCVCGSCFFFFFPFQVVSQSLEEDVWVCKCVFVCWSVYILRCLACVCVWVLEGLV